MRRVPLRRFALVLMSCAALTACDKWLGESGPPPLPGKRIAILSQEKALQPDPAAARIDVRLPRPESNGDWPQAGGYPTHAMHHMELGEAPQRLWRTSIGSGSRTRLLSQPVVAEGRAYALDADNEVSAIDAKSGDRLWRVDVTPEDMDSATVGGGVAYDDGKVFVSTGFAQVVALDGKTGKVLWRQNVSGPMRGAPTVYGGRVVVQTLDNQTFALSAEDGKQLWNHTGIAEAATLLGGTSPAIDNNVVVVAYSSGELYALRLDNGAVLWSDSLTSVKRTDQVATMTDIRGRPIIDRGRVYAVSNSDMLVAIDLRSGRRLWDRDIGSIQSPWIAGDYLYLITNTPELVALEAKTGRVHWVTQLQRFEDEEDKSGRLIWAGPILAGDRLIISSSEGWSLSVSPYTGRILGKERMPDGVTIAPVVADKTLFFLTEDADLVAYR